MVPAPASNQSERTYACIGLALIDFGGQNAAFITLQDAFTIDFF